MTRSVRSARKGSQQPRVEWIPAGEDHPDGQAAVELVAAAGLTLDPWQEHVFRNSLRRRGGRWAAFEVGLVCPRQNGKNALLEARELVGLFLLGEQLIVHSAHLADTAKMAFRRVEMLIESNEWLSREVKHVWRTNGHESLELHSGQMLRFRTRTGGGGRGFSGDCVIFDEAMEFPEAAQSAIFSVVTTSPDPQLWYTGSAVDQLIHANGRILTGVRDRGIAGGDPSLAYFEWSVGGFDNPHDVPEQIAGSPDAWAEANPALGIRVTEDYIGKERRAFRNNPRGFAVERLGVGDWPALDGESAVIDLELWDDLADRTSQPEKSLCVAFDVAPDRSWSSIAVAGRRLDGKLHVEVLEHRRGAGWLADRVIEVVAERRATLVCDGGAAAGSIVPELEKADVEITPLTGTELAHACGLLLDVIENEDLRHLGQSELDAAVAAAVKRPLGEKWAWGRSKSPADISPLVACTLALWGVLAEDLEETEPMVAWA